MKKLITLIVILLLVACKTETKKDNNETVITQPKEEVSTSKPKDNNETYLCRINSKDWAYTKASGIVSTHAKTKKRTALITFKKKLEKGSEHLQLTYDAVTFQLIAVSVQLRLPKKDGKLSTAYFDLKPETRKRHPESELSGSIDLSNASVTIGTAEITNLNINYEKDKLKNAEDSVLNITGLKFENIGYSDTDKLVNTYKN
ncbi:hypothetical protein [Psychroserpens ponticola]|uniref:Auto-transporter adhesin head GIN domain-containing protein n=1 Tax=Psychroserpens ponticola TaxID=2932268 RepID=A0ABY7RX59_9FLAO|nr:hypothetical protein [Psychroserpens ponticola]WCO01739.1 hypothetical protein MUN68_016970 [Psychroserpens ponticola]